MSTSCCVFHLVVGMYDLGATLRDALCGSSKHVEAPTGTALLASLTPSFPYLQRTSLSWPFCGLTLGPFPLPPVFLSFSPFLPFLSRSLCLSLALDLFPPNPCGTAPASRSRLPPRQQ